MSDEPTRVQDDGASPAAEYVLGVLSANERRDIERRLAREPALRSEIEYWERRLGVLASEVQPVTPSPATWSRLEAALAADDGISQTNGGLWQNILFWRWATIGSTAVAASLAALVIASRVPAPGQPLIAKLDVDNGQAGFVAAIDPTRDGLTIVPASVTNVNQRVLELWLIPPGDKPRSLGLIEAGRPIHIHLSAELMRHVAANATLAVSVEPLGGSPTGQPTGPVIANGKLTNL